MFELLTEKLGRVFKELRGRGRLSERDIQEAMSDTSNHQAAITWEVAEKVGIQKVVDWLKEYALHGGNVPLKDVLEDMWAHTPWQAFLKSLEGEKPV